MRTKKWISAGIAAVLVLGLLCSCAQNGGQGKSFTVRIVDKGGNNLYDGVFNTQDEKLSAMKAFESVCASEDIEFVYSDGFVESINGEKNGEEQGWLFLINDKLAEVGAEQYIPAEEDVIVFAYLNYSEAFGDDFAAE